MFVENFLLPRFLILELVLACHFFQFTRACKSIQSARVTGFLLGYDEDDIGEDVCTIYPMQLTWQNQPIFFSQARSLLLPGSNGSIIMRSGEEIQLSCPGSRTRCSRSTNVGLTCQNSQFFLDGSRQEELTACDCMNDPKEQEEDSNLSCGPADSGRLINIGFQVEDSFTSILSLCHNVEDENTYYAKHLIHGPGLKYKNIDQSRPTFKEGRQFYKTISASKAYSKKNQKLLLASALDVDEIKELFSANYLARGHLTPDADFTYKDWQDSTYYYGNTAPQWQSINNGNWKRLENLVRDIAIERGSTFSIFTGTLGVMNLKGEDLYLTKQQNKSFIPVPEYFFKIINDEENKESMAVFCTNNPLLNRVTRSKILCKDVCDEMGWGAHFPQRSQIEDGVIFCCTPEEASQLVPWAGPLHLNTYSALLI